MFREIQKSFPSPSSAKETGNIPDKNLGMQLI